MSRGLSDFLTTLTQCGLVKGKLALSRSLVSVMGWPHSSTNFTSYFYSPVIMAIITWPSILFIALIPNVNDIYLFTLLK